MCLAVPALVVASDGMTALVDIYGDRFRVDVTMLAEAVAAGDFVTVQARRFAVEKVAREEAQAARRLFEEVFPELAARAEGVNADAKPAGGLDRRALFVGQR